MQPAGEKNRKRTGHMTSAADLRFSAVACGLLLAVSACNRGGDSSPSPAPAPPASGEVVTLDRTSTITGSDADGNGVRDDIDLLISKIGTGAQKPALEALASSIQATLVTANDPSQSAAAAKNLEHAISCLQQKSPDEYRDQARFLQTATVNTEQRFDAFVKFERSINGADIEDPIDSICP